MTGFCTPAEVAVTVTLEAPCGVAMERAVVQPSKPAPAISNRASVRYAGRARRCAKRGWRASEVPTVWYPRASGTTKKGKNWLFGFRYARVVFGTWWRER